MDQTWRIAEVSRHQPGRKIGLWFWEVDRLPEAQHGAMELLDEVWVTCEMTKRAFDKVGTAPVRVIPLPILPSPGPTPFSRAMVGLPEDKRIFLCTYDFYSVLRRKNPLDVITAYTSAFGPDDGAQLVLKSINGHRRLGELEQVRHHARGRADILIMDGYLDSARNAALIELSDCLVSLHRSEGYGLNLADAMSLGRPVIATAFGGNLSFMDSDTAFLVDAHEVPVGPDSDPYPEDAIWGQPDVEHAATLMRRVFDDPAAAEAVGRRAQQHVLTEFSIAKVADQIGPELIPWVMQ